MRNKQMKRKIVKILTQDVKGLPRKERYLYILASSLFFGSQYMIIFYMILFLSKKSSYFHLLAVIHLLALIILSLILDREKEKLKQHEGIGS